VSYESQVFLASQRTAAADHQRRGSRFWQQFLQKSPMSEIAAEGGISKSLLFHCFRNKKDRCLFLWTACAEETIDEMTRSGCIPRGMTMKRVKYRLIPYIW